MKMLNRLLAAMLAIGTMSAMTACTSNEGTSSSTTTTESSTAATESSAASESSTSGEALSNEERFATLENPNITIFGKEKGQDAGQDAKIQAFEEKYGGTVTIITEKDSPETMLKYIAAGNAPDMVPLSNNRQADLLMNAALMPLEDLADLSDPVFEQAYMEYGTWRGHVYAVGPKAMQKAIVYNKTMFENNGLKTPYEYYKEGTWDFSTFFECAKQLTQDTNGDGTTDQWGFGSQDWKYPFAQLNGGGDFIWDKEEPKIDVVISSQETIEALQMLQDAILKDRSIADTPDNRQAFMDGSIAMVFETLGTMQNFVKNMEAELDFVPFPAGPNGDASYQPTAMSRYGIPAAAKNPEGGMAYLWMEAVGKEAEYDANSGPMFTAERWEEIKNGGFTFFLQQGLFTSATLDEANNKFNEDFLAGVPVATIVASVEPMYRQAADEWLKTEAAAWENANK
jgi:multiple sugar transport system substrate-binding protein